MIIEWQDNGYQGHDGYVNGVRCWCVGKTKRGYFRVWRYNARQDLWVQVPDEIWTKADEAMGYCDKKASRSRAQAH